MTNSDDQLIDAIYAAALDPGLWQSVLPELGKTIGGAESTGITHLDIVTGEGAAIVANNGARSLDDYFSYYYRINPMQLVDDPESYVAGWTPTILRDEDWMDRSALESSEFYNDFLRPIEADWGIILRLGLSGHDVTTVSIGRASRYGRFEDAEIATAAKFHPHLIRAVGLGKRFADVHQRVNGLAAAVDRSRSAMMVVDGTGTLLHGNAAAERMLRAGDILHLSDRQLATADPAGARALAQAIRAAAHSDRHQRIAGTFTIRLPGRKLPINGAVMPLLEQETGLFGRRLAALVTITDPILDATSPTAAISAAFGFTAAEGTLATDLLNGLDLREAATRRGVSINTVRTQLASLFTKTGTHRQVDLVQLLAMVDVRPLNS